MSPATPEAFVESDNEFFEMTGPLPTSWDDHRRHPRFYFRSCAEAIIYPLRGEHDPNAPPCFLLTRDLSRSGVSLIHTQQLFPGQRLDIILNGNPARPMEVVWCRRWTDNRYVIGCRFIGEAAPASNS
jgi:hypothetical protein